MPSIRWRICEGMEFLGIRLDSTRNEHHAAIILRDDSRVTVRVMKTDEELMIARHTHKHQALTREHFEDLPEVRDWTWSTT